MSTGLREESSSSVNNSVATFEGLGSRQKSPNLDDIPQEDDAIRRESKNKYNAGEAKDRVGDESDTDEGSKESVLPNEGFPIPSNKRIILQRFTIYNSESAMYIVGSNAKESLFRVLEIGKDVEYPNKVCIVEDKNYFYTRKDLIELINGLNDSIEGGIHKITLGYGLLGLIRFTKGYYLSIITKCSQVAILGGHYIYHVDETKLIPLDLYYEKPRKYSDEEKLLSIFKYLDLGKTFYFSYAYDITNSLQTNFMRHKKLASYYEYRIDNSQIAESFEVNERFVWNKLLLKPILENHEIAAYEWFQPIIHGFVDQASISIYGQKFYITIIARRSHHFAGARFLKRGVNDKGNVANEIETEQIVSDMLTTSFHDPKFGFFSNPRYTSFVQHRGSIPLFWSQDLNRLPKPPIEINLTDPYYQSAAIHFNNLFQRYGLPLIVLNLIKTKEKQPRELKLNKCFIDCVRYLNQFLPEKHKIFFYSFDMSKHSKKNLDVISPLQNIASRSIARTGFFHNGTSIATTKLQRGIIRTNCIDCLDRTNAAQFIICKEALFHQLSSLGLISPSTSLDYDSDLINILTEIFHDHGDTIAIQYGGSNLVNTMDSYRRINQWSSHIRDMLNSIKRIYSNSFMDLIRQEAINLFLGNYVYDAKKPKLWELQNDFHLHNDILREINNHRRSYVHWFNTNYFSNKDEISSLLANINAVKDRISFSEKLLPYPHYNDNWFNECYVPRKFQSMHQLFQFNMNSNARYFPNIVGDQIRLFNYSPFQSRKQTNINLIDARRLGLKTSASDTDNEAYSKVERLETPAMMSVESKTQKENGNISYDRNRGENFNDYTPNIYANMTNPARIKSFLATKIEKLGYSKTGKLIDYFPSNKTFTSSECSSSDIYAKNGELANLPYDLDFEVDLNDTDLYRTICRFDNAGMEENFRKMQDPFPLYYEQSMRIAHDDEELYKSVTEDVTSYHIGYFEKLHEKPENISPNETWKNSFMLPFSDYFNLKDNYFT